MTSQLHPDNDDETMRLSPNTMAIIALCNEYCSAIEHAASSDRDDFIALMLRLLPRIYISVTDIPDCAVDAEDAYIRQSLTEDYYNSVRLGLESTLGEDDTYLTTFEEDMKYSDTPIAASISEDLADIFQVAYNYLEVVRDSVNPVIVDATVALNLDFRQYWSKPLCNAMRALNALRYS